MKTYFDQLMEDKEFKEKLKIEYMKLKLSELKSELKQIKKQYKDDPQGLRMFSQGYKEQIKQLENDIKKF